MTLLLPFLIYFCVAMASPSKRMYIYIGDTDTQIGMVQSITCVQTCESSNVGPKLNLWQFRYGVCKCVNIDYDCCKTEKSCFENYCEGDERGEGAWYTNCKLYNNTCYAYRFVIPRRR
jgi:hypothetical protein